MSATRRTILLERTANSFFSKRYLLEQRDRVRYQFNYDVGSIGGVLNMTLASNRQPKIIRTERGLTISGTRITLYDIMDYAIAQYPPKFICALFDLSEEQINAALAYIETHQAEVEAEYQKVLKETEELRLYYEEQNRSRTARIATLPPPPGLEAAWEKLQAAKARHQLQA